MHPELPGLRDLSPPWLERLGQLWPARVALVDPDSGLRYTYGDLQNRSLAAARALEQMGVGHGDRVAAIMHNGVAMLDLVFACGLLGAILAPLNWRLSRRELAQLLDDARPRVVIAGPEFGEEARPTPGKAHFLILDDPSATIAADEEAKRHPCPGVVRMDDPWLILYTGGTTGTPKGAVLTHGSVTWNAINTNTSWGLSESDIGPSFTPMFHTGGLNVFTLPLLLLGGRVILPRRFDPEQALQILETERPTVLFMVPTMFQLVAEQPGFEEVDLSSLKWAISGGAPCPDRIYEMWRRKVPVFKQGYGLTEVGPNNFATPDADAQRKQGSVGRLTFFAQARIVDDQGNDVPDGTPGELLLAGPHMCAGYWGRPEATEEAIRDGWFHTGDVARRDEEGFYSIVDRKKDMIISGGENIYPAEIEAVLYQHPAVREAAAIGMPDPTWGEAVWAVVSAKPGERIEEDELAAHLGANLARYKVPKRIVVIDELPKSAAGKILRTECKKLVT